MNGVRFYDETAGQFGTNSAGQINPYTQGSYLNAKKITFQPAKLYQRRFVWNRRRLERRRPDLVHL